MAIENSAVVYTARNSFEAQAVRDLLLNEEIEAFVIDDVSPAGYWLGGLMGQIHKPRVVVNLADQERAAPFVQAFDEEVVAREQAKQEMNHTLGDVRVVCEDCDGVSHFPASRRGGVESCPHCGEFVDVEEQGSELDDDIPPG